MIIVLATFLAISRNIRRREWRLHKVMDIQQETWLARRDLVGEMYSSTSLFTTQVSAPFRARSSLVTSSVLLIWFSKSNHKHWLLLPPSRFQATRLHLSSIIHTLLHYSYSPAIYGPALGISQESKSCSATHTYFQRLSPRCTPTLGYLLGNPP